MDLPIDIINKILEYNGGYIKYRDTKTLFQPHAFPWKRGKYIIATMNQISKTDERYAMLRYIPAKEYALYRYKDGTVGLCITRIVSTSKFICISTKGGRSKNGSLWKLCRERSGGIATEPWERDSVAIHLDIRTSNKLPYIEYHCWFSKTLCSSRFLLY